MNAEVFTKRFVRCPACGGAEFAVEHLFGDTERTAGPWYCHACDHGITLTVYPDGRVDVAASKQRIRRVRVILEIPPQEHSIMLEVKGTEYDDGDGFPSLEEQAQRHAYYYEESTCPTNYLRDVKEVRVGDREDPHGLARFVSASHAQGEVDTGQALVTGGAW